MRIGPVAHHGRGYADQRVRRAAGRDESRWPRGAAPGPGGAERAVRQDRDRQAADLCDRPRAGTLRRAGDTRHRPGGRRRRLPLVVDDSGAREERPVSDEEDRLMIVTKKAISRRTILRGMGATVALPLLDAMIPALTAAGQYAGETDPPPGRRLPSERRHLRQVAAEGRRAPISSSRPRLPDCSRSRTS